MGVAGRHGVHQRINQRQRRLNYYHQWHRRTGSGKTGVGGGVYLIGGAKSPSGTDGDVYLGYNGTTTRGRVVLGATALLLTGTGSPESAVTAPVGSIFLRTDGGAGTTFYVKESGSGNTGWVGK